MARHFRASLETISRDLQYSLRRLGAANLKTSMDYDSGSADVRFDRHGQRYLVQCSRFTHPEDNGNSIEALRKIQELWGATTSSSDLDRDGFARFLTGWAVTPDVLALPSGSDWWHVLGVNRGASEADIRDAYRALARIYHPDSGGDADTFRRINSAYTAGLAAVGGKRVSHD